MATCPHADRLIPLLHDNELQSPLRREMVTHMSTCVICARTFSLLEREQELFTQMIEQRVDAIDFSGFWQAVEVKLSDPSPSGVARLRLWYESWRPAWSFSMPAWAAVALLLLVPTHLSFHSSGNNLPLAPPLPDITRSPSTARIPDLYDSSSIQRVSRAELESLTVGPGAMTVEIQHDYESNSIFIFYGDGTSEYPQ